MTPLMLREARRALRLLTLDLANSNKANPSEPVREALWHLDQADQLLDLELAGR